MFETTNLDLEVVPCPQKTFSSGIRSLRHADDIWISLEITCPKHSNCHHFSWSRHVLVVKLPRQTQISHQFDQKHSTIWNKDQQTDQTKKTIDFTGDPPTPLIFQSTVGVAKEMMFMDSAASGATPCVTNLTGELDGSSYWDRRPGPGSMV